MKRNAMRKNLYQSILKSLGRYIAIVAIIALGASMFVGLLMTKSDMVATGQKFMDQQNMFDLRLINSYGWTEEYVEAASQLDGVVDAEGMIYLDAAARLGEGTEDSVYRFYALPKAVNRVDLRGGRMPERADECLIDGFMADDSYLGRTVTISESNEEDTLDSLVHKTYTIVGYVATPLYLDMNRGTTSVGDGSITTYLYLPEESFDVDYYTEINLTISGDYDIYSDEYDDAMDAAAEALEPEAEQLAQDRFDGIVADAEEEYAEGYAEYLDGVKEFEEGRQEAEEELADAYQKLADGEQELKDNAKKLADGEKEIDKAWDTIEENKATLKDSEAQLESMKQDTYAQLDAAQAELDQNAKEITDGLSQVETGLAELETGLTQVNDGIAQLEAGMPQLDGGIAQLEAGLAQLDGGIAQLEAGIAGLESGLALLEESMAQLDASITQTQSELDEARAAAEPDEALILKLEAQLTQLKQQRTLLAAQLGELQTQREGYLNQLSQMQTEKETCTLQLAELKSQKEACTAQLGELYQTKAGLEATEEELLATRKTLTEAQTAINAGYEELNAGRAEADAQFADAQAQITEGKEQLDDAVNTLLSKEKELKDGKAALEDGRRELEEGWQEYYDGKAEADAEIADAEAELADAEAELAEAREDIDSLEAPELMILDRNTNVGYSSLESSSDIVQGVSRVFPAFFLLVAALVCITTMTRMIDEERTQIGTLKALGYSNRAIISKYLLYAGSGAIVGCGLGVIVGSIVFPTILWEVYKIMLYITDDVVLQFNWWLIGAVVASYTAVMLLVTWYCCRRALEEEPAELIRPKAPTAGKKIFMEYLPFWHNISFLNKVTIRNIFRYRQRLAMMMVGIGGCTALLLTGFGLRDSIVNVVDVQFENVTTYDMTVSFGEGQTAEEEEAFLAEIGDETSKVLVCHQSSVELDFGNQTKKAYMIAADSGLTDFISFNSGDEVLEMPGDGEVLLTVGVARMLDLEVGDKLTMRDADMQTMELTVSGIYVNHVSNYAIVSPETIESRWGEAPEKQIAFVSAAQGHDAHELSARIAGMEGVLNVSVSQDMADMVGSMLEALDLVVVVVVVCAGLLAVIVLYNLTNININERIREIATIKVLGFNATETAMYVFKENLSLSVIGAVLGLGLGQLLLIFVMSQIKIDMVWFQAQAQLPSYIWSVVLTICSAVIVDFIFYFKLDKINMAEALKSVE